MSLILVIADHCFFSQNLKQLLPKDPHQLFFFHLLFGLPHVLAGNIQLLDKEYLIFFKSKLIMCALASVALPLFFFTIFGLSSLVYFEYAIAGMHAAGQQSGILPLMTKFERRFFHSWKWMIRIATSMLAVRLIASPQLSEAYNFLFDGILVTLCLLAIALGGLIKTNNESLGKTYIILNSTIIPIALALQWMGYGFFSILFIRIPHDLTAFLFYLNHSAIRNKGRARNWLVSTMKVPGSLRGWYLPLLTIPLAFIMQEFSIFFSFVIFVSYLHYSSELFIWKRGTPTFSHLRVSK